VTIAVHRGVISSWSNLKCFVGS